MQLRWLAILVALSAALPAQRLLPPRAVELQRQLERTRGPERLGVINELSAWLSENDPNRALELSRQAIQMAQSAGDRRAEAMALHNIAVSYRTMGKYQAALETLEQARRLRQAEQDWKGVAEVLNTRGLIESEMGRYEAALETHLIALAMRQEIGDQKGQGYSLNNLATVHRATGDIDRAVEYLKSSIAIKEKIGDQQGLGYSLSNLGACYLELNRNREAIDAFEQSLAIRQQLQDHRAIADSMSSLGRAYARVGDARQSERFSRQALARWEEIGDVRSTAVARNGLGGVLVQQNRPQEALPILHSALEIAGKNRTHPVEVESLRLLAEAYAQSSDSAKALEFFRRYHKRQAELYNSESARRMAELKSRFDSQRQEQEIARLRLESERSRAEIGQQRTRRNLLLALLAFMAVTIALVVNRYATRRRSEDEYRRKNEELEEKSRQLEILNLELHRISAVKSRFLANMSHEIRTPMNGVMGMTDLLLRGELSGEQRHFAQLARSSAENLLTVVNDILDYAKIEADRLELYEKEFSPAPALEDLCEVMAVRAHARGLALHCVLAPDIPEKIHGDPDRLRQVLFNLLGNAIKFSEHGDVVLRVEMDAGAGMLKFAVSDQGVGIAADRLEQLFQPFSQVDDSMTRKQGGTGLGLVISRRLVELMGGALEVDSEPGRGSVFRFTMPANLAQVRTAGARLQWAIPPGATVAVLAQGVAGEAVRAILQRAGAACAALSDLPHPGSADALIAPLSEIENLDSAGLASLRSWLRNPAAPIIVLYPLGGQPAPLLLESSGRIRTVSQPAKRSKLLEAVAEATSLTQQPQPASAPAPLPRILRRTGEPARVLLVEDNRVNQTLALAYLKRLQCRVELASNGAEALQKLAQSQYDAVLMDVEMPVMDGLSATQAIRAGKVHRTDARIPIIAMTAHAMDNDRRRFLSAGMSDYVSKPVEVQTLAAVLRRWIPAPENAA